MDEIKTSETIDRQRRRFFGAAALTIAAAEFGMIGSAGAQAGKAKSTSLRTTKRAAPSDEATRSAVVCRGRGRGAAVSARKSGGGGSPVAAGRGAAGGV